MAIGKRATVKPAHVYAAGDRAIYTKQGEEMKGRVKTVKDGIVYLRIDPEQWQIEKKEMGDLIPIRDQSLLKPQMCSVPGCKAKATKRDGLCDEHRAPIEEEGEDDPTKRGGKEQRGIDPLGIKWSPDNINYALKMYGEPVKFYGWWRKARNERSQDYYFAIDIFAVHTDDKGAHEYAVDSITYSDRDPRLNMKSLSADIAAAANRWWFGKLGGKATNLTDLMNQAKKPQIIFNRLETLDTFILKLQELRTTALRAGGERHLELRGNTERAPVLITIDVSSQAMVLKGKVPSLHTGVMFDTARDGKMAGKGPKVGKLQFTASKENVQAIVDRLAQARASGDKKMARVLRAELRKMGHKGGTRSIQG